MDAVSVKVIDEISGAAVFEGSGNIPPRRINTNSRSIKLHFISDKSKSAKGFKIFYHHGKNLIPTKHKCGLR